MRIKMKNIMPAIVLGVICLIVAALLATINVFTAPKIEEQERLAKTASLRAVFGGDESGADFGDPMTDLPDFGENSYVKEIYLEKHNMGYAVVLLVPKGFEAEIGLTVGVNMNGEVTGVVITKYEDSLGKDKMPDAVKNFIGKNTTEDVTLVSGATYSSNAVKDAVTQALSAVKKISSVKTAKVGLMSEETGKQTREAKPVVSLTDKEFLALAATMLDGAEGFDFMTRVESEPLADWKQDYRQYKARIFRETSGKGYAVYGETFNKYSYDDGVIESNFVFVLDNNFTIVDFDLLGWSLSPGYNEELENIDNPAVKKLEESYIGVNLMNYATKVDLVTEATETSVRVEGAVLSVLEYLDENHDTEVNIYKAVGIAALAVFVAAIGTAIYFQRRRRV